MTFRYSKTVFTWVLLTACSAFAQSARRDGPCVGQLTVALQQAGDRSAWQTFHGVHVKGTVTARILENKTWSTEDSALDWVDGWSTGKPRYKRSFSNGPKQHVVRHTGGDYFAARMGKKKVSVRQFDSASVLLVHLPAISLAKILSDETYSIHPMPSLATPKDNVVQVTNAAGNSTQMWFLSKMTGQVDAVRFTVPDVLQPTHQTWETAIYRHYHTIDGLTFPDKVTVLRPAGGPLEYTFTSMDKNPAVADKDFTPGAAQ